MSKTDSTCRKICGEEVKLPEPDKEEYVRPPCVPLLPPCPMRAPPKAKTPEPEPEMPPCPCPPPFRIRSENNCH
ncbi:hypothetical protein RRG08_035348 [Elysia crispata]|uniref:Uncharacterized protein n=1 Tax=Elysia crispata TaxID=231223 RepID=A0AAE1CS31_9GAST|nr:hypothetical protein RRG08_035348 [Elysia crispata]